MRLSLARALPIALVLCSLTAAQPLVGSYTILPLAPTGGTNFASFTDAVNALVANGVAGPVTFELFGVAGPYTTPMPFVTGNVYSTSTAVLTLAQWPGASPTIA